MEWTSYHARNYKNGKINRKAECDAYFSEGCNKDYFKIMHSSMIETVYYAAIQSIAENIIVNDGLKEYLEKRPIKNGKIYGVVIITKTNMRNHYNFSYKVINENMGPCYYNCPKKIIKMLSATDNEYANKWREMCLNKKRS